MRYDFDTPVDRSRHHAAKYDERTRVFGTEQVIPLWIADMDLPTAQPILDAVTARAREGLFGYTSRPASYFEAACAWQARRHGWSPIRPCAATLWAWSRRWQPWCGCSRTPATRF